MRVYMCVQEQRCSLRVRRSRPPAWYRLSGIQSGQELVYHAFAPSLTVFCRSTSRSSMGLGRRCAASCSGPAVSVLTYFFNSAAQHLDAESAVRVRVCACVVFAGVCLKWRTKGGGTSRVQVKNAVPHLTLGLCAVRRSKRHTGDEPCVQRLEPLRFDADGGRGAGGIQRQRRCGWHLSSEQARPRNPHGLAS